MKCPKYIQDALARRTKAAGNFLKYDCMIVEWLNKNDIEVSETDVNTGALSICEPYASMIDILQAIENK